ncbi:DUF4942 domain-containing protein [Pseudomonas sp. 2FE]|uniref:DUF4942 domain-containing protein n=1 Tax=Pseudomonas sp. 2FE TaxID=2502190 RepID=UPI0010F6D735|nr:DUF4942 domain-containing protein [Pseudomonas sp. 2FE]
MQLFDHNEPQHQPIISGDIIDQFYAPVQFDTLTLLASDFERTKARLIEVHGIITQEKVSGVLGYFFAGNSTDKYGHSSSLRHDASFTETFLLEGALNELTASFWQRALSQTDLMEFMPQNRRSQWNETLNAWRKHGYKRGENPEMDLPAFTLDTLRATVQGLLARRAEFLAERVDGIFQALSRTHVSNAPEGFQKRMILSHVYSDWGSACHGREGYIHDLRLVVAKFMGRDEPCRATTAKLLAVARANRGEWIEADGGSIRIRAYKVGTAHLEVHPEMAWRLNSILAYLHPAAIPESFRKRPARAKAAGFTSKALFDKPLSNAIAAILCDMETYTTLEKTGNFRREFDRKEVKNSLSISYRSGETSKHLLAEVGEIMEALGGVLTTCSKHGRLTYWQFDYYPNELVKEVAIQGFIPDQKSHQFYPTPTAVGQRLVDWLDIQQADTCCEPQAGQGGIADLLPKDRTLCVEISPLHCKILREKGHTVHEGDFLAWNPGICFSVIAMNPPFSEGRWQEHLRYSSAFVEVGGRIGAVLPMSARSQAVDLLPGFDLEFSEPIENAFSGTTISVLLLKATKRA